jgi:zinc/manganese transport system substrate-binding protein
MQMRMTFSILTPLRWLPLALLLLALAGCGTDGDAAAGGRVKVVATTTQAADFVRHVGGSHVAVTQLLAPNTDPHEYEVRPQDVQAVAGADLIVRSGGDVDEWLDEAIDGSGTDAPVLTLSDGIKLRGDDPHWWQDPRNALIAVREIERALHRSAPAYERELRRLDQEVAACIDKVPPAQRTLVTTHDALGYYAARYGIDVVGTVIPSLSTEAQPSAGDIAALIKTIKGTGVKAIFAESSVNPKVEAAIARETGAKVGKALWADSLGPKGSDGATYVQSIESNTKAMVDGFTGGAETCSF